MSPHSDAVYFLEYVLSKGGDRASDLTSKNCIVPSPLTNAKLNFLLCMTTKHAEPHSDSEWLPDADSAVRWLFTLGILPDVSSPILLHFTVWWFFRRSPSVNSAAHRRRASLAVVVEQITIRPSVSHTGPAEYMIIAITCIRYKQIHKTRISIAYAILVNVLKYRLSFWLVGQMVNYHIRFLL